MPQKPQPPGDQLTIRGSLNLAYFVASVIARCVIPFLRTKVGENTRLMTFLAFVGMALYSSQDERMWAYIVFWGFAVVVERIDTAACRRRRELVHSGYMGWPRVAMLLPFIKSEGMAKLIVEPVTCYVAGWLLMDEWEALGKLFVVAAGALVFLEICDRRIQGSREQAAIDARVEAEILANGVRDRLGY